MLGRFLKVIKRNVIPFVIGAIIFSGITYAVAATIQSSSVTYTTNKNASVTNVKQAVDDLYQKCSVAEQVTYRYWNNNFAGSSYQFAINAIPTGSGLSGTYDSRAALASAYSSFASAPIYIKTIQINGYTYGHTACLWYNDHEFCIIPNYWAGTNTKNKLKTDMETSLGTTASSCHSDAYYADCYFDDFYCYAGNYGHVSCAASRNCFVLSDGSAYCS